MICVLPNFPQAVIDAAINFSTTTDTSNEFSLGGDPRTFCIQCPPDLISFINNSLPVPADDIHRFRFTKGSSNPHCDSRRKVALQIPVQIDYSSSRCFYAKEKFLEKLVEIESPNKTGDDGIVRRSQRWQYKSEYFDHYDYLLPFLMDTKYPHGGYVVSDTNTILLSVSYYDLSYKQLLPAFSKFK